MSGKIATCDITINQNWFSPGEVAQLHIDIDNSTVDNACHLIVVQKLEIS